jgi:two-component system cell cycle response regulator DivK
MAFNQLGSRPPLIRDSNGPNQPIWVWGQESTGVRALQRNISHLAEFFAAILVSVAMNTSRYQEAIEATRTPEHRYKVKRQRILIVEDDRLSLILLRQLLTAQGYEILQSSEGWDGINRARNERPDLIVMDIKLPDISGLDATLLLKKDDQTKDIPIIAVTACVTPGDKENALRSGCDAYIAKPVNMTNLLRTVEAFLPSSSA